MKEYLQILLDDLDLEIKFSFLPDLREGGEILELDIVPSMRLLSLYLKKYPSREISFSSIEGRKYIISFIIEENTLVIDNEFYSIDQGLSILLPILQPTRENQLYSYRLGLRNLLDYDLYMGPTIGKGGFSSVHLLTIKKTILVTKKKGTKTTKKITGFETEYERSDFVIKMIDNDLSNMSSHISYHEIFTLMTLKHPNIISLLDVINFPKMNKLGLLLPRASMDLSRFILTGGFVKKNYQYPLISGPNEKVPASDDFLYHIHSLVSGLNYMHERDFWHRDIKAENILYYPESSTSSRGRLIYSDFGISDGPGCFNLNKTFSPLTGTITYKSPESLLGYNKRNQGEDVWALGIILAEILLSTPTNKIFMTQQKGLTPIFGSDAATMLVNIFNYLPLYSWPEAESVAFSSFKSIVSSEMERISKGKKHDDFLEFITTNSKIADAPEEIYLLISSILIYMNIRPNSRFILEYLNEFTPQEDLDVTDLIGFEIESEKTCRIKMESFEAYRINESFESIERLEALNFIKNFISETPNLVYSIFFLSSYFLDFLGTYSVKDVRSAIGAAYMVKYDNGLKYGDGLITKLLEIEFIEVFHFIHFKMKYDVKKLTFYDFLWEKIFSFRSKSEEHFMEVYARFSKDVFTLSFAAVKFPEVSGYFTSNQREIADFLFSIIFYTPQREKNNNKKKEFLALVGPDLSEEILSSHYHTTIE